MKDMDSLVMPPHFQEFKEALDGLNEYELDALADAIHIRRLELMSQALKAYGFSTRLQSSTGDQFRYLLVYDPAEDSPGVWADLAECDRLIDTVRNLPADKAFARWKEKVTSRFQEKAEPPAEVATRQDVRRMRTKLQQQYQEGQISGEELRLGWVEARDIFS